MSASNTKHKLIALTNPDSPQAESLRTLRANLLFATMERDLRVILVTSAKSGEGKSTTAANLAILYAQMGKKTLLVDANLRKPTLNRFFANSPERGLTDFLKEDAEEWGKALTQEFYPNLTILTAGSPTSYPSETVASPTFRNLVASLRQCYEVIIIDSPPALLHSDTQFIASVSDATVLVIQPGRVSQSEARQAIEKLESAKAEVVGIVLNR